MYLTNVPTLENFALILFLSVLVGTSFSRMVWSSERFTWLTVVTSTLVFLVVLLFGQQRWNSKHGMTLLDSAELIVSGEPG